MTLLVAFLLSVGLAAALTPLVRRQALRYGIFAQTSEVKAHAVDDRVVPYLGGLAVWASFSVTALVFMPMSRPLAALLLGGAIVAIVGAVDDVKNLSATSRLAWQVVAAGIVLAGGIGIVTISNPFGGTIDLSWGRTVIDLAGLHFHITPIANLISILWFVGMINTINFLDGFDGLASGVSAIAGLIIFALAISPQVDQPLVALLAIILVGSCLGFLPFNFFPARIFMGDGGAYFLGLTLALLAVYSGAKLATVGLVLGFTIIDAMWAVIRRVRRRVHPFTADREHLHHLLMQAGLSMRGAVLSLYLLAAVFGVIALKTHGVTKFAALIVLLAVMVVLIATLIRLGRRRLG